jgi:hypothetical protein
MKENIEIKVNPNITKDELFSFYSENQICEEGYGKDISARVLDNTSLIVAAYCDKKLIGLSRTMFDGLVGEIVEFCLAIDYQGENLEYDNGSIVEQDKYGVGKKLGQTTISELHRMGAFYISATVFEDAEKDFFGSIGLVRNEGHINYIIDERPYI